MMKRSLVVAHVSVAILLLNGCSDASIGSASVPAQTLDNWVTEIKNNKYICSGECKDFVKVCTKSNIVSSADKLNGVSESVTVGFTYALFINAYKKYYDRKILVAFKKVNGLWKEDERRDNGINIKECTF